MNKMIKNKTGPQKASILWLIIILAILLRIFYLSKVPNGFFCDEASRGYDAYSVLNTLRDRHGAFLPLFARSFGDYPESLYMFLTVPSVATFGLNEFATRLPAAIAGIFTVLALYFLAKELFNKKIALVSALLLAISPWHIQFSRNAMSGYSLMLLFFCLGLLFFMKALNERPEYLVLSALIFSLNLYTYYSARVFVPLFIIGISIIFFKELLKHKGYGIISIIILLTTLISLFSIWISPKGLARADVTLQFSIAKNIKYYLSYFNPLFLFFKGDPNLRHSILNMGQLYLFEFITILVGIINVCSNLEKKENRIILIWLILYPIPASLTEPWHAARSIIGAPLFSILSALGIFTLLSIIKPRIAKSVFLVCIVILITSSFIIYCKLYYYDYPKYSANDWQYGMKEAISYAEKSPYDCVILSNRFLGHYIFVLFYTKYPPSKFQNSELAQLERDPFYYVNFSIGKYSILELPSIRKIQGPCLFIITPQETFYLGRKKKNWRILKTIRDPNGNELIKIVEVRN